MTRRIFGWTTFPTFPTSIVASVLAFSLFARRHPAASAFLVPSSPFAHSRPRELVDSKLGRSSLLPQLFSSTLPPENDDDEPPKLGIDLDLDPMTAKEADELKAAATELLNDAIAERLDDISDVRETIRKDFERAKEDLAYRSDKRAAEETEKLLGKIDSLTDKFLGETEETRSGTKLAAKADRAMIGTGEGVDLGSWGRLGGGNVLTSAAARGGAGLLGSVDSATRQAKEEEAEEGSGGGTTTEENRVLILADPAQDPSTKKLVDRFSSLLSEAFDSSVAVDIVKPSSGAVPLGGSNARTAILFASSFNDRSGAENALNRILKRVALPGGKFGVPPTHLVCVSSLGTTRTNKFPYSAANFLGGKLDKKRGVEEAVISFAKNRLEGAQPPLDYTVIKFGDVVEDDKAEGDVTIAPGDVLDGSIGADAAGRVLLRSVAYQPSARNATLSAIGGVAPSSEEVWDDMFLRLDGPELLRIEDLSSSFDGTTTTGAATDAEFERLAEYLREWSQLFEGDRKGTGLTTPVDVYASASSPSSAEGASVVERTAGVRIAFRETKTGEAYVSRSEEKALERERSSGPPPPASSAPSDRPAKRRKAKKEGGVEILVERTKKGELRVRARRCDADDDTVVKEMSESLILKRLKEGVDVWRTGEA